MGTNFKFYTQNKIDANTSFAFTSSSTSLSNYVYDNNYNTQLVSSGSDDLTSEVYIMSFGSSVSADFIGLFNHNFKNYTIQYSDDNQSSWSDFTNAISETTNTETTNIYEVTEVTSITDLKVSVLTTQITDAEKVIGQIRLLSLIGEVSSNPYNMINPYNEKSVIHGLSDGGNVYIQFGRKMNMIIDFDDATSADLTIFRTLKDRFAPFYVYPNGVDTSKTQEPFRIRDMFLVNYVNSYEPNIRSGFLLDAGTEISLQLQEV